MGIIKNRGERDAPSDHSLMNYKSVSWKERRTRLAATVSIILDEANPVSEGSAFSLSRPKPRKRDHMQPQSRHKSKRHLLENMFAKLKDWRRVATRYDRCAHSFMSAIHIAVSFIFYPKE